MKKSYREVKQELDKVLEEMQDPDTDLDKALLLHAKGKKLLKEMDAYLHEIEEKIKTNTTKS